MIATLLTYRPPINSKIVKIKREGYTFEGDSRSYLPEGYCKTVWVENQTTTVSFTHASDKEVAYVLFDVGSNVLKKVHYEKSPQELMKQLELAKEYIDRYDAVIALEGVDADLKREALQKAYKREKHYGIQGRSTVLVWLRKHGKLDWSTPIYFTNMPKLTETPAQKIKRLERELEDLRLKNLVKDEMINIMDEEYGAGLRKKYISELSRAQKKTTK